MRRSDREIIDINEILEIIGRCEVCNLGLSRNDMPYVVPLNFGYVFEDGRLTLYLHCANGGKKLDIIAQNSNACFSMYCGQELLVNEKACAHSMFFESVMGAGTIEILSDKDEKRKGLLALMKHCNPGCEAVFSDSEIEAVTVLRFNADEFTAKRHKPGKKQA